MRSARSNGTMDRMSTILIIDDDPRFRTQARDLLEADGFIVIGQAVDGASGLEAAQSCDPTSFCWTSACPMSRVSTWRAALAIDGPPPLVVLTSSRDARAYGRRLTNGTRPWLHPEGADLRGRDPGIGRSRMTLRLVLADDSVLVREGVARLLADAGFEVVAQVGDADDLLRATREHLPDVAIVDIRMPPTHTDEGLRAAEAIRAEHGTAVGILVLSQHVEPSFALRLVSDGAGGVGYLLKDRVTDLDDFADAIRRIAKGGSVIDPAVVAVLVGRRSRVPARRPD